MVAVRNVAVSCGAFSLEEADVAQRVEVRLSDDLTGADIPPGRGETVTFVLDGKAYEIDLTAKNAAALRKALRPYVEAGRAIEGSGRRTTRSRVGADTRTVKVGADARTVKAWARANGYRVRDRGRVPNEILAAFDAAN
jgi:hypothetical protein